MWLIVGYFAGFTLGSNDTKASLLAFALLFALPIAASVAVRWVPTVSGVVLLASFVVILLIVCANLSDALHALARPYLWFHLVFGIAFIFLAAEIKGGVPEEPV